MINKRNGFWLVFLVLGVFILSACSSLQGGSSSPQEELPETYEIPGFGYSIGYPEGWTVKTRDNVTAFTELVRDNPIALSGSGSYDGYVLGFEHRTREFLVNLGLEEDANVEQLLAFNSSFFNWDASDKEEISLFGGPAIRVAANGQPGTAIMGFNEGNVYLLTFSAPTVEAWEAFQPIFESMLASVEEVGESQ